MGGLERSEESVRNWEEAEEPKVRPGGGVSVPTPAPTPLHTDVPGKDRRDTILHPMRSQRCSNAGLVDQNELALQTLKQASAPTVTLCGRSCAPGDEATHVGTSQGAAVSHQLHRDSFQRRLGFVTLWGPSECS